MGSHTVILDIGAYNNKLGLNTADKPRVIPNYVSKAKNERRKVFFGDQLNECKDFSGLFYVLPFQKGYLVNWDVQRQLFHYMFSKNVLQTDTMETNLVVTEPQFNFTSTKECLDEILFEEYKFKSVCRTTAGQLAYWKRKEEENKHLCCLVIDSGFSFTHIIPVCNGKVLKNAVKRVDVGGKHLTNHLKEIISYRQLHVLDETYVMNQVKEDCCYVSNSFLEDLELSRKKKKLNTIARDYILPDYTNVKRGFIRPLEEMWTKFTGSEQVLRMNNERFTVPEILFNPSDIGIQQMGIPEATLETIESTPMYMQPHFLRNIVLTGGNAMFDGYYKRVFDEIRTNAPVDLDLKIHLPENPITYAWEGGCALSQRDDFIETFCVTNKEYEESGRVICSQRFDANFEET